MKRVENVIRYYLLCNTLKDMIRTGWQIWNVKKERIESVAEHVYGVQMLAIAMHSEFEYKDLDLSKVLMMLALHELEEISIGDKCWFEISDDEKKENGHKAIIMMLKDLLNGQSIADLILEFDEGVTKEAIFAYNCDKLECDLQAKIYDEENRVDISKQDNNPAFKNQIVLDLVSSEGSFSGYWLEFDKRRIDFDSNFLDVLLYAKENKITDLLNK